MAAEYDDQGTTSTEGFDVETGEWKEGFESQREAWEKEYAEAHSRYEQHIGQIREAAEADAEASEAGPASTNYSSQGGGAPAESGGLAGQRRAARGAAEKLSGGA